MPIITLETEILAPIERVFDLARSIDLHQESLADTNERAVGGVTSGLIGLGETVTWEAVHFGVRQKLTSKITACEPPHRFSDTMVSGAFARFDHQHFFEEVEGGTFMRDIFDYDSPLWVLGWIADALFLESYMRRLLIERNRILKETAEGDGWKRFISC